jgi:large subunit ribosomal protein L15e
MCKPKTSGGVKQQKPVRNLQSIAEERVGRRVLGLRILSSYWVGQDSTYKYFEVIMIDVHHKAITRDPKINWMCGNVQKHRELRGLTTAGKSSRGKFYQKLFKLALNCPNWSKLIPTCLRLFKLA